MPEERRAAIVRRTPLGRLGQPDDIASVVAFLASDEARWVTGQIVDANGGLH
jgi:3-oxoacyl-[acyl-carrier protein] reductase